MSWHYLQEQEEVSSEDISWDGVQFVPSKSKTTLGEYCLPDNETESSQDSQSGMTLRHSTELPGEGELMWYQGDSPVRTYLPLEKEQGFVVSDLECGPRWPESLARYNPATYSWRTAQCSLVEGLELYSETFPQWGMMHDGEFWERITLPPLTSGTESGSWPRSCSAMAARITPESCHNPSRFPNLETMVGRSMWPTPSARDWKDSPGMAKSSINQDGTKRNRLDQLPRKIYHQDQTGGLLNPNWVEWLMGWPVGWTGLKPLATDKFQQWQHLHGNY